MSVENEKVIDIIGINKEGKATLTISDHLVWDDKNEHLLILQNKINTYIGYIEDRQYFETYPDAIGKEFIIQVIAKFKPDDNGMISLDTCRCRARISI